MRTRPSRRAVKAGLAALMSFTLVAAACGGSDDSSDGDGDADTTEAESTDTEGDASEADVPETTEAEAEPEEEATEDSEAEGSEDDGDATQEQDIAEDEGEGDPVPGGTLRLGMEADVDGLNPTFSSWSVVGYTMGNAVFDPLVRFDDEGVAQPYLAESWTPNEDFTSWDLKVREGITFHDGTPLNAEALVANFQSQLAAPVVGLAVRPFYPAEGAVEVVDQYTARFNLLDANAYWPGALASQLGYVASPTWLAAAAEDPTLNQEPVGTGPFVFESRSADSVTRFVKNEEYWNADAEPYLDAVEFYVVTDPDERANLLFEGELDSLHTSNPATIAELRDSDDIQNILDDTGEESWVMINSASPPFDDSRARQALALATPRTLYNQLINLDVTRLASQRYTPESKWFNPDITQVGDDPEAAAPLVAEYCGEFPANCSDGKINMEFQFSGPSVVQTRIADLFEEAWADLFNVTRDELPQDEHISQTVFGQYNVNTWRSHGAADPWLDNVWLLCRTAGDPPGSDGGLALNFPRLCDETRSQLLLQAQATTDEAERISLYQQAEQLIADDYVYVYLNHTMWDNAFSADVRGMCDQVTPDGTPLECTRLGNMLYNWMWFADG